jgi:hypothetical protein
MSFEKPQTTNVEVGELRKLLQSLNVAQECIKDAFQKSPDYSMAAVEARVPALHQISRAKELTHRMLGLDKPKIEIMD